jgi:hypothetical protein
MYRFGGFQSGKTFLIDRLQLIEQLERVSRGDEVSFERDRRTRLVGQLTEARRLASGRHVRSDTADDVRDRVLKDLSDGIHLKWELRIEFEGAEDLLRHLYELSQAIVNDYERFQMASAGPFQLGVGRSMWSMTSTATGICLLSSLSPSCVRTAVNNDGRGGSLADS